MGLFCGFIGLIVQYIGLFYGYTGLFPGYTGLFCGYMRLFCRYIRLLYRYIAYFGGYIGLFSHGSFADMYVSFHSWFAGLYGSFPRDLHWETYRWVASLDCAVFLSKRPIFVHLFCKRDLCFQRDFHTYRWVSSLDCAVFLSQRPIFLHLFCKRDLYFQRDFHWETYRWVASLDCAVFLSQKPYFCESLLQKRPNFSTRTLWYLWSASRWGGKNGKKRTLFLNMAITSLQLSRDSWKRSSCDGSGERKGW